MKYILETHKYAPELNRLHFKKGGSLPAPGCTSIRAARDKLFGQVKPGKAAVITVKHQRPEHNFANRIYRGRISSLAHLKDTLCQLRARHNLDDAVFTVQTKVVG